MNRISLKILQYILDSDKYWLRIRMKRSEYKNIKDFTYQVGYIIMDIVNKEPKFFDINRNDIDIDNIAQELF